MDTLSARLSNLEFDYTPPEKNFDKNKVKGLVAKLIRIKNPEATLALEVAAGSKLYNVKEIKLL